MGLLGWMSLLKFTVITRIWPSNVTDFQRSQHTVYVNETIFSGLYGNCWVECPFIYRSEPWQWLQFQTCTYSHFLLFCYSLQRTSNNWIPLSNCKGREAFIILQFLTRRSILGSVCALHFGDLVKVQSHMGARQILSWKPIGSNQHWGQWGYSLN